MNITKKSLIILIFSCILLGYGLGIFRLQQYQVSADVTPSKPVMSPTKSRTITPAPSTTSVQSITPDHSRTISVAQSATRDVFYCLNDFVDWSAYESKSLDNIRHDIGHYLSWKEKDGFFKTKAHFVGRLSYDGTPSIDNLSFPVYLFEQNEIIYPISVNPRINNELEKVPSGTELTLFIEVNTFSLHELSQILLQDYKILDNQANTPDTHWAVAIQQNGVLLDQPEITIKNQPFTIFVYLPRITKEVPIVLLNINETSKWQDNLLLGHSIYDSCGDKVPYIPPNYPFCPGSGPTSNGDRAIRISNWHYVILDFYNCDFNNMSEINFDAANIVLEKDILNFAIPENDGYVLSKTDILPLSEFANKSYELTFFLDLNENEIFDAGEIQKMILHITE